MCVVDLEPCDLWREDTRRARKSHVCDCCGGAIDPGEVYISHFSIFDGDANAEKMCALCELAVADFQQHHRTRSNPSFMRELFQECVVDETERTIYIDDRATRELTMLGDKWRRYLDEMDARRAARRSR